MTFLEQLQQSAGLLSNNIASSTTYNPTTSDFRDGVAQNRFVGNQFQMPTTSMTVPAVNIGTSPNFGSSTYTPLPFNALNLQLVLPKKICKVFRVNNLGSNPIRYFLFLKMSKGICFGKVFILKKSPLCFFA